MFMQKMKKSFRNKRGSSLPMVVAIGLVLVIWTMSLSPIVATQGKTSIDVQNQEEDYLQSRSAIEFTKGELLNMVAYGAPGTFAVLKGEDGEHPDDYSPLIYKNDPVTYADHVNHDGADPHKDTPKDDKVAAICAVKKNDKVYDIKITTFNNGESGLTYNTTYTPPVLSKMINPEAYKKTQALPLSDFVLVDGKYGNTVAWNSTLLTDASQTYENYFKKTGKRFSKYSSSFKETFLTVEKGVFEGDTQNLHAVFKTTAEVAPVAAIEDIIAGGTIDGLQALPLTAYPSPQFTPAATVNGNQVTINITLNEGEPNYALYACTTDPNPATVDWTQRTTFTMPYNSASVDYYVFCYISGHAESGDTILYSNSPVVCKKVTVTKNEQTVVTQSPDFPHDKRVDKPENGKEYLIYTDNGDGTYTYLSYNKNDITKETIRGAYIPGNYSYWKVTTSGSKYEFKTSYDKYLAYLPNYPDGYLYLTTSDAPIHEYTYSDKVLSLQTRLGDRYLYFKDDWATWKKSDATKVYFLPKDAVNSTTTVNVNYDVSTSTFTGTMPPYLPADVTVKTIELKDKTPMSEITSQFTVNGSSGLKVFLTSSGSTDLYDVYGVWTKDELPRFNKVGEVKLLGPDAKAPIYGYGIQGAALYFMGEDYAIATSDKPIYLKADLLVIRDDVASGDGSVNVYSYSEDQGTLVFFVNGTGPFKRYNFYKLPNNTTDTSIDLSNVSAAQADAWLVRDEEGSKFENGTVLDEPGGKVTSIEFPDRVLELENSGKFRYPVINFDIAYATPEQLAYVVSGEAIKWTSKGVLQNSSDDLNSMYVVCPYITSVNGDVTRSANRILTYVGRDPDVGTRDLSVSSTVNLYTRYLSFDTDKITKDAPNAHFYLHSLTQQPKWSDSFDEALGVVNYSSKTLQVDYECSMELILGNNNKSVIDPQICRYDTGADLFNGAVLKPLQAEYTTREIQERLESILPTITIVDRYVDISGSSFILYNFPFEGTLHLYSNYVSFDKSLKTIIVPALRKGITFSSQETGYTENEYLFLFHDSTAEAYNGTLIHFESDVMVYKGIRSHEIKAGFYAVPSGETRNIWDFNNPDAEHPVMKLNEDDLLKYSSIIKEDGSMESVYVDAGFETDDSAPGGFGGGTVNK